MDIRIGIINAPREVSLEMGDDTSAADVKATVEAGIANGSVVWLTDRKGRQTGVPGTHIAYVEIGSEGDNNRIGFS